MLSLQIVKSQLEKIGAKEVARTAEIERLPELLESDEVIGAAIYGRYAGSGGSLSSTARKLFLGWGGIFIATQKRVIMIGGTNLGPTHIEDLLFEKLTSVTHQSGLTTATVTILASGTAFSLDSVNKVRASLFVDYVRQGILRANSKTSTQKITGSDVVTQLERLGKLNEQGLITEEEFIKQKKRILE